MSTVGPHLSELVGLRVVRISLKILYVRHQYHGVENVLFKAHQNL